MPRQAIKLSTQYFCQIDIHITQSIVTCIIEIQIWSRNINPLTVKKDSIGYKTFSTTKEIQNSIYSGSVLNKTK